VAFAADVESLIANNGDRQRVQAVTIRRFITVLALTTLAACGGGGGSSPTSTPPPTNQSVGGIWKGRFTTPSGVSVDGLALVADNGSFYSEAKNLNNGCADVATGTLTTNGSKVSGTAKFAIVSYSTVTGVQTNCVFPDGSTSGTEIISGSVVQGSTLTLTGVATTSKGTTLPSSTVTANFDNLYKESSSLGQVAGNWTGPTGDVMTVSANGALASQDPTSGCDVNGHIS
jgi:hypothetical protein